MRKNILILTLTTFLSSIGSYAQMKYSNPVTEVSLPDPTVIQMPDGSFYTYGTEDISGVPVFRSKDLVRWIQVGTAFTRESRPSFLEKGSVWAPDINYINGKYLLYYTLSRWGEGQKNGIGVAVADKPEGPFRDCGALFTSNEIGVENSIDQCFIEDKGKKYLFWGSFKGIYAIELTDDGLGIRAGAEKVHIAGNAFEASYVHKRKGYYYLFASIGSCCEGVNSTYQTVVGRSKSLMGPYRDAKGGTMLDNNYEIIISGNDRFAGTGHNSEIVTDATGAEWILYHAYDRQAPRGRKLMLDRVEWNKNWPKVNDGTPSDYANAPIF